MCIVSFVLDKEKFILTFNRDEDPARESEKPKWRTSGSTAFFSPIDNTGGGTWIGYNKEIVACLQNGALIKHKRHPPYRRSRGLILKEILETDYSEEIVSTYNFNGIEPFTLSIFYISKNRLFIYRFDGIHLTTVINNLQEPLVLSSCTLYDTVAQKTIENDFHIALKDGDSLFNFHDEHRIGNVKNKYTEKVSTVSITQFELEDDHLHCKYYDLLSGEIAKINK